MRNALLAVISTSLVCFASVVGASETSVENEVIYRWCDNSNPTKILPKINPTITGYPLADRTTYDPTKFDLTILSNLEDQNGRNLFGLLEKSNPCPLIFNSDDIEGYDLRGLINVQDVVIHGQNFPPNSPLAQRLENTAEKLLNANCPNAAKDCIDQEFEKLSLRVFFIFVNKSSDSDTSYDLLFIDGDLEIAQYYTASGSAKKFEIN